jgi:shikimate dehydrogenase
MTAIDKYAVFGNPIKHSRSPQIHTLFAEQTHQDISYRAFQVELGKFSEAAKNFFDNGGKGLNITVPFKLDAFEYADQISDRARRAGAINTLALQEDGSVYGDNTDGVGLVRDLTENLAWDLSNKRVLVLGAGGAVRGILEPLINKKPRHLLIANRTVSKARELTNDFSDLADVRACSFEALSGNQFDLIINGTSAGHSGEMPHLPTHLLTDEGCCYDMTYGTEPTLFMRWAAANAAWAIVDGVGMLVEQAAESFCIWRGKRPQTRPVIDLIKMALENA